MRVNACLLQVHLTTLVLGSFLIPLRAHVLLVDLLSCAIAHAPTCSSVQHVMGRVGEIVLTRLDPAALPLLHDGHASRLTMRLEGCPRNDRHEGGGTVRSCKSMEKNSIFFFHFA